MVNTILQMYPVGPDGVCVIADSHVGTMHFQTMTLYVRSGGGADVVHQTHTRSSKESR